MAFQTEEKKKTDPRLVFSLVLFLLLFFCFSLGIRSLSADTKRRQRENLETALNRSIAYCYAVEGAYPESLSYLIDHYGLTYDHDRFFVDYRILGANLYPDVTILEVE